MKTELIEASLASLEPSDELGDVIAFDDVNGMCASFESHIHICVVNWSRDLVCVVELDESNNSP
jgi:hypothetical protein